MEASQRIDRKKHGLTNNHPNEATAQTMCNIHQALWTWAHFPEKVATLPANLNALPPVTDPKPGTNAPTVKASTSDRTHYARVLSAQIRKYAKNVEEFAKYDDYIFDPTNVPQTLQKVAYNLRMKHIVIAEATVAIDAIAAQQPPNRAAPAAPSQPVASSNSHTHGQQHSRHTNFNPHQ